MLGTSIPDAGTPAAVPGAPPRGVSRRPPATAQHVVIRRRRIADAARGDWVIEFDGAAEAFVKPLTGWIGARVRLDATTLDFPSLADAVAFAQRHGWLAEIRDVGPLAPAAAN